MMISCRTKRTSSDTAADAAVGMAPDATDGTGRAFSAQIGRISLNR